MQGLHSDFLAMPAAALVGKSHQIGVDSQREGERKMILQQGQARYLVEWMMIKDPPPLSLLGQKSSLDQGCMAN
jgi:hypothetical protein